MKSEEKKKMRWIQRENERRSSSSSENEIESTQNCSQESSVQDSWQVDMRTSRADAAATFRVLDVNRDGG